MIERTQIWLSGRSSRERALLAVMSALLAVLLLWLIVVLPIDSARRAAMTRLDIATADAGRVSRVEGALREARTLSQPATGQPLTAIIGQAAEGAGFTMARLDAQTPDRVTIAISTAKSPALFAWLTALEKQGVIVDRLTLRPNSDATIAVEGVVRGRGK